MNSYVILTFLFHLGFFDECKRRYNIKLWKTFTDCFNCLPIAAIIDEKIFCCHGGLSPDLQDMEQIRRIVRPTDVPDTGLLCDLLWSDPDKEVKVSHSIFRNEIISYKDEFVQIFIKIIKISQMRYILYKKRRE